MKFFSKLLGKIQNNKARIKKTIGIGTLALGLRCDSINPSATNLSSNSQQIKKVQNFVEEDIQLVNTFSKYLYT